MIRVACIAVLLSFFAALAHADPPKPTGMVTDIAGLIPDEVEQPLEAKLRAYREKTSIEVAVLVIPSLEGREPSAYVQELWMTDEWAVGTKNEDNGALLLVVPPPEKIAWIATGYGLEPYLTDLESAHIVEDVMKPLNLKEQRVDAVIAGVDAIIAHLGDTPWADRKPPPKEFGWGSLLLLIVIIVVVLLFLASQQGNSGNSSGTFRSLGSTRRSSGSSGFGGFGGGRSGGGGGGGRSG